MVKGFRPYVHDYLIGHMVVAEIHQPLEQRSGSNHNAQTNQKRCQRPEIYPSFPDHIIDGVSGQYRSVKGQRHSQHRKQQGGSQIYPVSRNIMKNSFQCGFMLHVPFPPLLTPETGRFLCIPHSFCTAPHGSRCLLLLRHPAQ